MPENNVAAGKYGPGNAVPARVHVLYDTKDRPWMRRPAEPGWFCTEDGGTTERVDSDEELLMKCGEMTEW